MAWALLVETKTLTGVLATTTATAAPPPRPHHRSLPQHHQRHPTNAGDALPADILDEDENGALAPPEPAEEPAKVRLRRPCCTAPAQRTDKGLPQRAASAAAADVLRWVYASW